MNPKSIISKTTYLLSAICLSLSCTTSAKKYEIEHLEPAFWWVDMQQKELQLLVHGENISELSPRINSDQIILKKVNKVDNPNYLFLDIIVREGTSPHTINIEFLEGDKIATNYQYQLKAKNKNHAADVSYSSKDVIYLITPDRFANGDKSNDKVPSLTEGLDRQHPGGRHGGDIQGIIDRLAYIEDMGYTQLWLNPVIENNQPNYSYHGYSATDFYNVDARYGDNALYKKLSDEAQKRGIGLIIDIVLNHGGSGHWWHNDLPMADWYNNQGKAYLGTNHKREALHDPYAADIDAQTFSDGWFVPTMPDLNQKNPFMAKYLIQNTLWWIEFANLSGIRVDTYSYPDKAFLSEWTKRVTQEYPNINIVGEEWTTNPAIVSYWQKGKQTPDGYQSYLPSVMDFPIQDGLVKSLKNKENWNTGLNELYRVLANDFLYPAPDNLVIFPDNHDMSRIFTQLDEDYELFKIAMTFMMTTRGIPQIFYGTEILMSNPGTDDHGVIRTDFPGGWPTDSINGFTGKGLTNRQKSAQQFMKKLLNWRKNTPTIHQGKLMHYAPENGVYVYFRYDEYSKYMVVINKNTEATEIDMSRFSQMLGKAKSLNPVLNNRPITIEQTMIMPAKTATIYQVH
ncbi:glycoside hydrolase family 13 protein [Thalassotalea sp. M1531]|uniref:Glycoside hydrolase family 13 protein n=1 Tax=Thalassotalea algicola TaxID=2716224 RepID=A0A7Y0L8N9_9GAMM|nr:glycoside hydrolase family 13 protein [Thalassotalea algicola]NMP30009.1 glycoside hydrolase family 13 protein [Thalassotalea algicola]